MKLFTNWLCVVVRYMVFQNFVNVIKTCVDVLSFFQEQTLVYFQGVLFWPNSYLVSFMSLHLILLIDPQIPRAIRPKNISRLL